jgi:hypothetical protein
MVNVGSRTLWSDGDTRAAIDDDGSLSITYNGNTIKMSLQAWHKIVYRAQSDPIGELLDIGDVITKAAREVS